MKNIIFATSVQKVLEYIIDYPETEFTEREIRKKVRLSKSAINYALRKLCKYGLITRRKKGGVFLYSLNHNHIIIKQIKILKNIINILPLVQKIKKYSIRIMLFGSASRGENWRDSDIDLVVIAKNKDMIPEIKKNINSNKKIKPILVTELGFMEIKKKDPVFYREIENGITLWNSHES